MLKTPEQLKAESVEKIIRQAWASLETHLKYTHEGKLIRGETHDFHKECVREYLEIMNEAAKLY